MDLHLFGLLVHWYISGTVYRNIFQIIYFANFQEINKIEVNWKLQIRLPDNGFFHLFLSLCRCPFSCRGLSWYSANCIGHLVRVHQCRQSLRAVDCWCSEFNRVAIELVFQWIHWRWNNVSNQLTNSIWWSRGLTTTCLLAFSPLLIRFLFFFFFFAV